MPIVSVDTVHDKVTWIPDWPTILITGYKKCLDFNDGMLTTSCVLTNYSSYWWKLFSCKTHTTFFWNSDTTIFWNSDTTIFWNGDMCRMRWGEVLLHWTGILSTLLGRRHSFRLLLDYTLWSFFTAALNLECVLGRICKLFDSRLGIKYGHLGKLRR